MEIFFFCCLRVPQATKEKANALGNKRKK